MGLLMAEMFDVAERNFIPLVTIFELTHRCNERCTHCYLEEYGTNGREELTTAEVKSVLDGLAAEGGFWLTLSGGEIFLRRDFFEIAEYARRLEFGLTIFSNAMLVTDDIARRLKALHLMEVGISVYSANAESHDEITKVKGSFAKTMAGARRLRKYDIPVNLKCPLMKSNLTEYQEIIDLAKSMGARYSFDPTIVPKNDGGGNFREIRLDEQGLRRLFSDPTLYPKDPIEGKNAPPVGALAPTSMALASPSGVAERYEGIASHVDSACGVRDHFDLASDETTNMLCGAGRDVCGINPYGDVFPCIQLLMPAGNLKELSFREIWRESDIMKTVRGVTDQKLHTCQACQVAKYCNRCPGLALIEHGDLYGPSKAACEVAVIRGEVAIDGPVEIPLPMLQNWPEVKLMFNSQVGGYVMKEEVKHGR